VFERAAIFDSYACRKGKGREAALARAGAYAGRYAWFLKLDIRKFFDSVDQAVALDQLSRHFKDQRLLDLFRRILATYSTAPEERGHSCPLPPPSKPQADKNVGAPAKGLPIGNLTSQHLANDYLAPLDRFVKETLACPAYVRYMDDFVLWSDDRALLRHAWTEIESFLASRLKLTLKASPQLNRTCRGMDFLGCRLFPGQMRLSRRSKQRFARKLLRYEEKWRAGEWTEADLQRHAEPLLAFVRGADSEAFRRAVLRRSRVVATGLEPRHTGRQLEQRCQQLRVGQPQQQQPVEPQQQQRVPRGPRPSSPPRPVGRAAEPDAIPPRVTAGQKHDERSADIPVRLTLEALPPRPADRNVRAPLAKVVSPPGVSSTVENSGRTSAPRAVGAESPVRGDIFIARPRATRNSPARGGMFIAPAWGAISSPVRGDMFIAQAPDGFSSPVGAACSCAGVSSRDMPPLPGWTTARPWFYKHVAPLGLACRLGVGCYKHAAPTGLASRLGVGCYKHAAPLGLAPRLDACRYKHGVPTGLGNGPLSDNN